ncbi:acyl carrier protein [Corynebacterium aquatimens]|uniref:acyl carrier protein n=1 Tax=Corynebacterium TaxID=1716 RepID=UPI001F3A4F2C|nr:MULTISPECIES: acyl carrier protein [Corynebacterium]QYH19434.1 acyl carrier protein [Corynebacterium aquatimens]UIZ91647.1 acyl carrier protein [Corynebacterium sp. CNCTC7651]
MELSQRLNLEAIEVEPDDAFSRLAQLIDDSFNLSISPTTALADSGLSSLDRIELAIRIEEHFGVRITEAIYDDYSTAGALAEYLAEEGDN